MEEPVEEAAYFLLRAKQEQARASEAEKPEAVAAHRELAMRYSVKALMVQVEESEQPSDDKKD